MKFYHYPHCPFCQRVRILLSLLDTKYEAVIVSYADIETPTKLIGAKMLPIIEFEDGAMGESLDLMHRVNEGKIPNGPLDWASRIVVGTPRYFDLVLPWYLEHYKQEFGADPEGARYFKEGKEAKRGVTFEELKAEARDIYEDNVESRLKEIMDQIQGPFLEGDTITLADLVLTADLTGLRCVEGLALPLALLDYMRAVEAECGESLLEN